MASISRYKKAMLRRCVRQYGRILGERARTMCGQFVEGHISSFGKRGVKRHSALQRKRRRR